MRESGSVYAWISALCGSVYAQYRERLCVDRLGYPLLFVDKPGDVAWAWFEDQSAGAVFHPCFWVDG